MPLSDLIRRIGQTRAVQVSRYFVRWWVGELTGLWQDARDRLWPQSRRPIRVTPEDDNLPADVKGRTAIIVLPAPLGLVKPIRMPRMARAHVRSALALQLERHAPLPVETLHWDYEIRPPQPDDTHVVVELCVVRRAVIDREVDRVRGLGLRPVRVALSAGDGEALRFNLLGETRVLPSMATHAWNVRLATGAAVLLLTVCGLTVWQRQRERLQIETALDQAKAAAQPVVGVREELIARVERHRVLNTTLQGPSAAEVLAELTRRLPRDVWLDQFSMKDGTVRVAGKGPAFGNIASILDPSPLFHDVTLASSAPEGVGSGQDRFEIAAAIEREVTR